MKIKELFDKMQNDKSIKYILVDDKYKVKTFDKFLELVKNNTFGDGWNLESNLKKIPYYNIWNLATKQKVMNWPERNEYVTVYIDFEIIKQRRR